MKPYSLDLRCRVLNSYDSGQNMRVIAKTFSINIKTIYLWKKQREERGFIYGITKYQKGHSHKILDIIAFKEFVDKHLNLSTAELAKELNISISTLARTMRKTDFIRKKNSWVHRSKDR